MNTPFQKSLLIIVLTLGTINLTLQAQTPRRYEASSTRNAPVIDGVVSPGEWDDAAVADDWHVLRLAEDARSTHNDRFRAVWDDEALYLLYESDYGGWSGAGGDGEIAGVGVQGIDFNADNINIYIDPNTDGESLFRDQEGESIDGYQIAWNNLVGTGTLNEGVMVNTGFFLEAHVNSAFGNQGGWGSVDPAFLRSEMAQVLSAGGGVVELKLVWADLDAPGVADDPATEDVDESDTSVFHPMAPQVDDVWTFNVSRITTDADNFLPIWSWQTAQGFALPPHGELVFTGQSDTARFGTVANGATYQKSFELENVSETETITITGITPAAVDPGRTDLFTIVSFPSELAPGSTGPLVMEFSPGADVAGDVLAAFDVASNAGAEEEVVPQVFGKAFVINANGLVGRYLLNESEGSVISDSSGLGPDGEYKDGASLGQEALAEGTSVNFMGTSYGEMDTAELPMSDFTVSLFANVESVSGESNLGTIFGLDEPQGATALLAAPDGNLHWFVGSAPLFETATPAITLGETHHIAAVYSESGASPSLDIYVDGSAVISETGIDALELVKDARFLVGSFGGSLEMNGRLDDIQIYDRAIRPEEAQFLADNPGQALRIGPVVPSVDGLLLDFGNTPPNANGTVDGWVGVDNLVQDVPFDAGNGVTLTALEDGFNPNNTAAPGTAATYDGIEVPAEVRDDYLFKIADTAGTSAQIRIDGLTAGEYNVTLFEGRTSDAAQVAKIWVGEEPADENTGSFAGGSATVTVQVGEGDPLFYRHLEDGSGGISGMIIRRTGDVDTNILVNGSFEEPVLDNINMNNLGTAPTGWSQTGADETWNLIRNDGTVYGSGVDTPAEGSQILDLDGLFEIFQNFTLTETSNVTFGASFANREGHDGSEPSTVGIYDASGTTLLSPEVSVDTSADPTPSEVWRSGEATATNLPAGDYQIRVALNNYNNVDDVFADVSPGIDPALAAYWKLDEVNGTTTPDTLGAYPLTLVNLSEADLVAGARDMAMAFSNANSTLAEYIAEPGDRLPINLNPRRTISLWVKAKGTGQTDLRFFAEASTTDTNPLFNMGTHNTAADDTVDLYIRPPGNHEHSEGAPLDDEWHHLAWVSADDGTATLYIDGVADTFGPWSNNQFVDNLNTTSLGGIRRADPSHWFTGALDDVALWARALTTPEVARLAAGEDPLTILPEDIPPPPLTPLTGVSFSEDGNPIIGVPDGETYDIQWSSDLIDWETIAPGITGSFEDTDPIRAAEPMGFYRGVK